MTLDFATITELTASGVPAVAITEHLLDRIRRLDPGLDSFICLAPDALEQARKADAETRAGRSRGLLHGIPIGIKDNYLTADMPTTAGTTAPGVDFPRTDSAVAARLRAAGAILIGKTRTHEYAWGTYTPPVRNPWDLSRIPGGSSGGSGAAVAAGLCPAAMGSDTGGSIRIPASFCGTVGLKPTFGRISRAGIVPHSWSLDHAGPLTRSVADAALLLQVLAGEDAADPGCSAEPVPDYRPAVNAPSVSGLRVAVIRNHFFGHNHPDIDAAVETAIAWFGAQGAVIRDVMVPNLQYGLGAIFAIELASSAAYHDVALRAGRTSQFTEDVRLLVEMGRLVTGADVIKAEQFRQVLKQDVARVLADADIILGPTEPVTAPRIGETHVAIAGGEESALAATWRLTYPYNLTGLPAITLPCGFDAGGLPIGLQIAAAPFAEPILLRTAAAYEAAHDWKDRHPANA
ncbi:MAG TPA: amidase [Acetobacteraceae bacterium]|nr:amidase [Acetobacteraceae bacterium]